MTTRKPFDHELSDTALDLQAERWAEQAEARSRQRAILDARKKEWRNAPPHATGLKPFSDLWLDVEAQRRGAITKDTFWAQVVRTILEGFFDQERRLLCVVDDETRITSETLKPALQWDEEGSDLNLMQAIVRDSWATIATLSEWARHQRYETPISWRLVLEKHPKRPADLEHTDATKIGKAESTRQAVLACMSENPQGEDEQKKVYIARISKTLKARGIKAGDSTVKNAARFR